VKFFDVALLLMILGAVPFLFRGFRNHAIRLQALSDVERSAARNGILLGVGISALLLVSALAIGRHLIE
jgi:hypothetical protein